MAETEFSLETAWETEIVIEKVENQSNSHLLHHYLTPLFSRLKKMFIKQMKAK